MKSTSLSIADKIDPAARVIYQEIHDAARSVGVDCLVVGATARDMIYQAAYGLEIRRATADIDFAIQVESWDKFAELTGVLVEHYGLTRTKSDHRLMLPNSDVWIDIIPFGAIAGNDNRYRWPDDPDSEISVLGFQEALDTAVVCQVSLRPDLTLRVVHPAVLVMLKIFGWYDRRRYKTTDAQDAAYAMSYYVRLGENQKRLYEDPELFEGDFDVDTIGARLVGRDLAKMVAGIALDDLRARIQGEIDLGDESDLLADMQAGSPALFADRSLYSHLLPNLALGIDEAASADAGNL